MAELLSMSVEIATNIFTKLLYVVVILSPVFFLLARPADRRPAKTRIDKFIADFDEKRRKNEDCPPQPVGGACIAGQWKQVSYLKTP